MEMFDIARIEARVPGVITIEGSSPGLVYFFDHDKDRLVIAGRKGFTEMTVIQAKAMIKELPAILEDRHYFTEREIFRVESGEKK